MALHDFLDVLEDALLQQARNIRQGNVAPLSSPERIAQTKYQVDCALREIEKERKVKHPPDWVIFAFLGGSVVIFVFIGIALGVFLAMGD